MDIFKNVQNEKVGQLLFGLFIRFLKALHEFYFISIFIKLRKGMDWLFLIGENRTA